MKRITLALLSGAIFIISHSSCKKDQVDSPVTTRKHSPIYGNWRLISAHSVYYDSSVYTNDGSIFKSAVRIEDNANETTGFISITDSTINASAVSYAINTNGEKLDYKDDQLIDVSSNPYIFNFPSTTGSSKYEIIGQDSIHAAEGTIFGPMDYSGPPNDGAKFSISGNRLTLFLTLSKDSPFYFDGVLQSFTTRTILSEMKFEKQ